jgi:hypothetical protein
VLRPNRLTQSLQQIEIEVFGSFLARSRLVIEKVLYLLDVNYFFGRCSNWPEFNELLDDEDGERRVFFYEVFDAGHQLRVEGAQSFDFVEGDEHALEKSGVFFFEGDGVARDHGAKDLEQFSNSVVFFGFIDDIEQRILHHGSYDWT